MTYPGAPCNLCSVFSAEHEIAVLKNLPHMDHDFSRRGLKSQIPSPFSVTQAIWTYRETRCGELLILVAPWTVLGLISFKHRFIFLHARRRFSTFSRLSGQLTVTYMHKLMQLGADDHSCSIFMTSCSRLPS